MGSNFGVQMPLLKDLMHNGIVEGPVTKKESSDGRCEAMGLSWGVSCMQGWRSSMEDVHLVIPQLQGVGWEGTSVFGVMDGHGGEEVARFCARHLPAEIATCDCNDVKGALIHAYERMDEMLADPSNLQELQAMSSTTFLSSKNVDPDKVGCTAVVCCARRDTLVIANAGDCRVVLCRRGRTINMTTDHKPNMPSERTRITKGGGVVVAQRAGPRTIYRVNGELSLSRAIGDLYLKRNRALAPKDQIISCTPDIATFKRQAGDEFMVLACDGVWDVLSSQEVVKHVRAQLQGLRDGTVKLSNVVEAILDRCLSSVDPSCTGGLGGDNMTMMIVVFPEGNCGKVQCFSLTNSMRRFGG